MSKEPDDLYLNLLKAYEEFLNNKDTRSVYAAESQMTAMRRQHQAKTIGDKEQYLTWSIANEAYQIILEEHLGAKDALIKAAENHTDEVAAVLAEKSNPSKGMNKSILENHDRHPVQKDMVKRKKFNRQGIKNTKNVWQMLNLLSYFREAYKEALELEKVKEDVATLQTDVMLAQEEIKRLQLKTGNSAMTDREKAALLKNSGYNQVDIAKAIGVNKSTVSRWWPTL